MNPQPIKKVLIVGAGIAGCSTAITLAELGLSVTLIEKQDQWRFQSSGIFVYSNVLRALQQVGVLPQILEAGFALPDGKNIYLDHSGALITNVFYPSVSPGIPPILGIKRSEIHRILAGKLATLGVNIKLATTVTRLNSFDPSAPANVVFNDGNEETFDLIIAADGIRSQIRQLIFPEISPRNTHFGVWRSVHARPAHLRDKYMQMGIGKRLGIMPISDDKLYIFGTVPEPGNPWFDPQDWPRIMREKFAEFQGPARTFLNEVSEHSEVLYTVVEEVAADLPWHKGRVLLLGDAAHASTPFMGQGGAMAIEDAVVLKTLLQRHQFQTSVLEAFGTARYPVCRFVQDASRKVGEAGAIEDAASCLARNHNMQQKAQLQVDQFYQQLETLNSFKGVTPNHHQETKQ